MSVSKNDVLEAIQKDLDAEVEIEEWEEDDLTKPGDNFGSIIKSIRAKPIWKNRKNEELADHWKCVAKLNNKKQSDFFQMFSKFSFNNEIDFFLNWLPEINSELDRAKQTSLNTPRVFAHSLVPEEEKIFLEDLRLKNLRITQNSRAQLSIRECQLVLKELARMHAASHSKAKTDNLKRNTDKEPDKVNSYLIDDSIGNKIFSGLLLKRIQSAIAFLGNLQADSSYIKWLESVEKNKSHFVNSLVGKADPKFLALCHADTWTNNYLFE